MAPHRSSKFLAVLFGSGAGGPVAHHPAKVSSSSAAVPHHCGLLPSCRSSPLALGTFVRRARKLRSDPRCTNALRVGGVSPSEVVGRGVCSVSSNFRRVSKARHRLASRFQARGSTSGSGPPRSVPLAGPFSWGSPHSPLRGRRRLRRNLPAFAERSCSTSVRCRSPFPVRGALRRTRWLDGSPGHLESSGFQVIPSFPHRPSTRAPACRPADSRVLLHRRVQAGPRVLRRSDHLFLPWVCFPFEASLARPMTLLAESPTPPGLPSGHPGPGFRAARLR